MDYVRVDPRGRSLAGIAGSNRAGGMDVCLLWVLCDVKNRCMRRVDHSSYPVCWCVCVCVCVTESDQTQQ